MEEDFMPNQDDWKSQRDWQRVNEELAQIVEASIYKALKAIPEGKAPQLFDWVMANCYDSFSHEVKDAFAVAYFRLTVTGIMIYRPEKWVSQITELKESFEQALQANDTLRALQSVTPKAQ